MAASLELAISAIRAGRKEEGRQLLNLLIQQDPNNEQAWLWMSSVVNTDEQRARCLYHVLAINPTHELARKGLSLLGIVVTDSRPVKIPRDSQPIPIPAPSPEAGPDFPHEEPPASPAERRPFRIDPAIVKELPFTPVNQPAVPVAAAQADIPAPPPPAIQTAPPVQSPVAAPPPPNGNNQPAASPPAQPYYSPPATQPLPYPGQGPMSGQETRPTQPLPALGAGLLMPPSLANQNTPSPYPAEPVYYGHPPMGMPTQYLPGQPSIHSNSTLGMPLYPQPAMVGPGLNFHANPTMAMPTGYDPFAALTTMQQRDYRLAQAAAGSHRPRKIQEEDDEQGSEVNILAVIIFGSLSVTALGGLGMLILLMFTG